jgi:hypothetical protein
MVGLPLRRSTERESHAYPTSSTPCYAAVVERPLFSPTRRPAVIAAEDAPAAPVRRDELVLRGVMLAPHKRVALIEVEGEEPRWLAEGEGLDGWTLEAVHERHVVLGEAGATRELALQWEATPAAADRRERRTPTLEPRAATPAADPSFVNAIMLLKAQAAQPAR